MEDRAQSALGAEFSSGLSKIIFKRKIYVWIFVMKKANTTFKTFKMLNADLSQEDILRNLLLTTTLRLLCLENFSLNYVPLCSRKPM